MCMCVIPGGTAAILYFCGKLNLIEKKDGKNLDLDDATELLSK